MTTRPRLRLEPLEGRWCPALTATLNGTTLNITGTADNGSIVVNQDSTTAGTINVLDGTTAITGSPFTGVTNIRLNLTNADDAVTIDLGGQTLAGGIRANLGGGADSLNVVNGGIERSLRVRGGNEDDTVTLGDGTNALSLRDVALDLYGGIDTVQIQSGVTVSRSLATLYANNVTLAEGSTVENAFLRGGSGGNTFEIAGDVTGNLHIDAFFRFGSDDGTTVNLSGDVDGRVSIAGSNLDDTVTIAGNIGGSLSVSTFGDDDKVDVSGAVTGRLGLECGAGNDTMTISNVVGGKASISAGSGDDSLTMSATAQFLSRATINMGAGADAVTLDDAATILTMLINGGTGTDVFTGTTTRTGLTLISF
jgi:hypothetical protein